MTPQETSDARAAWEERRSELADPPAETWADVPPHWRERWLQTARLNGITGPAPYDPDA